MSPVETVAPRTTGRLQGVDALRGLVMIIMALDHVRDFVHSAAMSSSPTDLTKTTAILFLTRWITHYCLPVFMFTAGIGVFFMGKRKANTGELSRFLWTRGLWFVVLELTVMQFSYDFNFHPQMILLLVLWIFGICMLGMAALVWLPPRVQLVLALAVIVLHNMLDGVQPTTFGSFAWVWDILHQPGVFPAFGKLLLVTFTWIPWIAVMLAGYCFGRVLQLDPERRRGILLKLGAALTIGFFVLRLVNRYGDPVPWATQKSAFFTVLSFLNCTKYPASLDFLLMTIGPAILVLAYFDSRQWKAANPLMVFGRVPLFYFVLHFYLIHIAAVVMAVVRYGPRAFSFMFNPLPSMGGPAELFPADFGYSLPVVYAVWAAIVVLLYPLCRWFGTVKSSRREWWLSYL